ncbi:MAG: heavy-metal-associated domain-containing protein [Chitinophagaceae bacterium]
MKSLTLIAALFFAVSLSAQEKTETFNVAGNCGMCKTAIEKAAKQAGAKEASWNKETKQLTVTYQSSSTNTAKIQQAVAARGYDNVGFKTSEEAYSKLPGCCKYDREAAAAAMGSMDCCKDGKCSMPGHDGKDCCKKSDAKMDCCKDGKCSMPGHDGKDCCKKADK